VLTPGTALDGSIGSEENNFLAAVAKQGDVLGLAVLDLSTGDFRATEFSGENAEIRVLEELQQLRPREVLFPSRMPLFDRGPQRQAALLEGSAEVSSLKFAETPLEEWAFALDYALPLLENHFGVLSL